jgi:hypothetical protein
LYRQGKHVPVDLVEEALEMTGVPLINNSRQCFMNGPSYRPNKAPARVVRTGNTSAS